MGTPEMDIAIETGMQGTWHVLAVTGEIDLYTAPALRDALANTPATSLAVDLRGVRFMDSMGLGVLIGARRRATEGERGFALICGEGPVLRVLDVSGLTRVFDVVASPAELPDAGQGNAAT